MLQISMFISEAFNGINSVAQSCLLRNFYGLFGTFALLNGDDFALPVTSVCCLQADFNGNPDSLFFNDGKRRIDLVLVYEDESKNASVKKGSVYRRRVSQGHDINLLIFLTNINS